MGRRVIALVTGLVLMGLALASSGHGYAQQLPGGGTNPVPPGAGGLPPPASPQTRPTRPAPDRRDPGRPLPFQSAFQITGFASGTPICRADLTGASVRLTGDAPLQADPVRLDGRHEVGIEVNGRTVRTISVQRRNGRARIDETVDVPGASGDHQVVFVLDGVVRSQAYRFSHSCLAATGTRAPPPGTIQQQTRFAFIAQVRDGLRSGAGPGTGSTLTLVVETTDGRSFEFTRQGGIPDNSVLRIDGTVPLVLNRDTLHRVRLYIDDVPLGGLERLGDAGDSASFGWMLIETGPNESARTRIWETGQINLTLAPKRWWQTLVLSMRRFEASTPVRRLAVTVSTGADDLRVGPLEPRFHSLLEVFWQVPVALGPGLTGQTEQVFGERSDEQVRRLLGSIGTGRIQQIPPALTATEERQLQLGDGDAQALRALQIKRMRRAFLFDSSGLMPTDGARNVRPFGSHGTASTTLTVAPGTTLRDVATVFFRVDLGLGGNAMSGGIGQASIQPDQWDYAGVSLSFEDAQGNWRTLYRDTSTRRWRASGTFTIQVQDESLVR